DDLLVGRQDLLRERLARLGERRDLDAQGARLLADLRGVARQRVHRAAHAEAALAALVLDAVEALLLVERARAQVLDLAHVVADGLEHPGDLLRRRVAEAAAHHPLEDVRAARPWIADARRAG